MRVVVTGATSMIGIALIKECIANNCEVLAIVREGSKKLSRLPESKLIKLTYADLDTLETIGKQDVDYDVFYHFAWGHTSKTERDLPLAQENNIRATLKAVELAKKLGCKKFVGAGSQAEYGPKDGIISEDTEANPVTAYGMAKLSANLLSRKMCEQLEIQHIWGRIFSVYGTNDNEGTMINYAIKCFKNGEVAKFSAATQMWNYLFEDDAGKMFYLLGEKDVEPGVYNIANDETKPLKEFILELKECFNNEAACVFAEVNLDCKVYGILPCVKKLCSAINYSDMIVFNVGKHYIVNNI